MGGLSDKVQFNVSIKGSIGHDHLHLIGWICGQMRQRSLYGYNRPIAQYAPQTWSEVPEEHWDQCKFDGKIITIPEDQYTQWVNHGFYYRGDWAEEFGITEPIRHWDTLGEYLQKVKDIKGVIPYDVAGSKANEILDYWMAAYTDSICLEIPGNIFYSKSYDDLYTVYSPIFDDTMVEMAKKMKEWGDAGY